MEWIGWVEGEREETIEVENGYLMSNSSLVFG